MIRSLLRLAAPILVSATASLAMQAQAATRAPPMLDVAGLCGRTFHSASAMSECVVAESEARAEILSHWAKYPEGDAERCVKLDKKAKKQPYTAMAKCLAPDSASAAAAATAEKPPR